MKPGSSAAVSRGGFVENMLLKFKISRIGSTSATFTSMSLFRNARSSRSMSSWCCSNCCRSASGTEAAPLAQLLRSSGRNVAVSSVLGALPSAPEVQSNSSPSAGGSVRAASCASQRDNGLGLSCALMPLGLKVLDFLPNRAKAPLAHLASKSKTSASDTMGNSSPLSNASTKATGNCSHCVSLAVTSEKCLRLLSASLRLCLRRRPKRGEVSSNERNW
mmetsp:Transcript_12292/g.35341  ORF Transcript_12292/g.35341 Transcript_12292/m.35341 type:complete len:219 (+) Transcript_12292:1169-1825(+)